MSFMVSLNVAYGIYYITAHAQERFKQSPNAGAREGWCG